MLYIVEERSGRGMGIAVAVGVVRFTHDKCGFLPLLPEICQVEIATPHSALRLKFDLAKSGLPGKMSHQLRCEEGRYHPATLSKHGTPEVTGLRNIKMNSGPEAQDQN